MGAVKRKKAPVSEAVVSDPASQWLEPELTEVCVRMKVCAELLAAKLANMPPDAPLPQALMRVMLWFETVGKQLGNLHEAWKAAAILHRDLGGAFEHGTVAISFPVTSKRNPAWKVEAVSQHKLLLAAQGAPIDESVEKAYVEAVLSTAPVSTSESVKLTLSA